MHCLSPSSYSYHYFLTSLIIRKRYVLPNAACEVMYVAMYCLRHCALEGGMRIVSFKGTLGMHVLNYVTSLVILGIHALNYVTSLVILSYHASIVMYEQHRCCTVGLLLRCTILLHPRSSTEKLWYEYSLSTLFLLPHSVTSRFAS